MSDATAAISGFWVDIHKLGSSIFHPKFAPIAVTREYCARLMDNHARLTAEGYEVPVMRKHIDDGMTYGCVHAMRLSAPNELGEVWLQGLTDLFGDDLRQAYNAGRVRKWSPGIERKFLHPHTGEVLLDVMVELSFTSREYQLNVRPPQVTNPGVRLSHSADLFTGEDPMTEKTKKTATPTNLSADEGVEETKTEESPFDAKTAYAAMSEEMNSMKAVLAAINDKLNPKAEEPKEEPKEEGENVQMSARIAELEDANARLQLSAAGINDGQDELIKLNRLDKSLFRSQVDRMVKLSAQNVNRQQPISGGTTAAVSGTKTPIQEIVKLAAAAVESNQYNTATEWMHSNGHEDRVEEFLKL